MRMKLLTETSQKIKLSTMSTDDNVYIEGIFSTAENRNINGRIYRKSTLEREANKLMEKVANKCLWGELSHPSTPEINPDRISHLIESLEWQGNDLIGRAKIIDTPMGKIAKTLIKEGRIGVSSRGLGTVNETDNYVNDDYFMISYDLVIDPSNQPSWVTAITESKEFDVPWIQPTKKEEEKLEPEELKEQRVSIAEARKEYFNSLMKFIEKVERGR
jgi:hypothetical protein